MYSRGTIRGTITTRRTGKKSESGKVCEIIVTDAVRNPTPFQKRQWPARVSGFESEVGPSRRNRAMSK